MDNTSPVNRSQVRSEDKPEELAEELALEIIPDEDIVSFPGSINLSPRNKNSAGAAKYYGTFYAMALHLSAIGKQLADTYSEQNQEAGTGFVESLRNLEEVEESLRDLPESVLSISQKDGLAELIKYLQGKLHRRAKAIDSNVVNM